MNCYIKHLLDEVPNDTLLALISLLESRVDKNVILGLLKAEYKSRVRTSDDYLNSLNRKFDLECFESWGIFSKEEIEILRKKGIVNLYILLNTCLDDEDMLDIPYSIRCHFDEARRFFDMRGQWAREVIFPDDEGKGKITANK